MPMKQCITCRVEQPDENFARKTGGKRHNYCKICYNTRNRNWYSSNRIKVIQKTRIAKRKYRLNGHICWIKNILGLTSRNRKIPLSPITKHNLATKLAKSLLLSTRCVYTGDLLTPGVNLALDHRMPVSRAPEKVWQYKNLQWVSKRYNTAKSNMTDEEFRSFCELILANWHPSNT